MTNDINRDPVSAPLAIITIVKNELDRSGEGHYSRKGGGGALGGLQVGSKSTVSRAYLQLSKSLEITKMSKI
jgi:hypothetical protein